MSLGQLLTNVEACFKVQIYIYNIILNIILIMQFPDKLYIFLHPNENQMKHYRMDKPHLPI